MIASTCPVCENTGVRIYLDGEGEILDASVIGSSRKMTSPGRIVRCCECNFGFRQSRFSEEHLADAYRQMDPRVYEAELGGRIKTAARHLQIVRQYSRSGRILDVGCASGHFLSLASQAGFEVTGVEPSATLCRQAETALGGRGSILCSTFEQAPIPPAHFDVVTLWDVLEHVSNPVSMLEKCRSLLKPGGYLFLNVPDLDSMEARLFKNRWPLLLAEHLNYFNRPSLGLCGRKAGLSLVRFGRRRAFFSIGYVLYRLSQHGLPFAGLGRRLAQSRVGRVLIPVALGETYAVWQNASS